MNKRLYSAISFYNLFKVFVARVSAIFGLGYLFLQFDKNPAVISILAFFVVVLIMIIGTDQITVYEDRIVCSTNSFLAMIIPPKGQSYKIADIKSAHLQPAPGFGEVAAAAVLIALLPKKRARGNGLRPIYLDLKNGRTETILTDLEYGKMEKIVELVNSLTDNSDEYHLSES